MSLRINSNFAAMSNLALRSQRGYQTQMGKSISHISTGKRFSNASEDAAGYVSGSRMKVDATGYDALDNGTQRASAYLSAANEATTTLLDTLYTMKEKALAYAGLSSSDATGAGAGAALSAEYNELASKAENMLGFTLNGTTLLTGGQTFTIANDLNGNTYEITWDDISSLANSVTGSPDITIANLASTIQDQIDSIVSEQVKITSGMSGLEKLSAYMQMASAASDDAYNTLTEVDMAKEMTSYVKNNIYSQASQAMIAQANQSMAQVLNLLQ